MLKFVLIISLIIMENETRNIYISGGLHYRGKENSKIYIVKSKPPSQFNPIISECNRKKCISDNMCYFNHKCCYESLCGHNICKKMCDDITRDIETESTRKTSSVTKATTFPTTDDTDSTTITTSSTIVATSTEPEDFSTLSNTPDTTITTLITIISTSNKAEDAYTPSTTELTKTTISPASTSTIISSSVTNHPTSTAERDDSSTLQEISTYNTTNSITYISETTVENLTVTPRVTSTEIDQSVTSDSDDDLVDHTSISSTIDFVTSTLKTTNKEDQNEDVSTTVETKSSNQFDDTSDNEGSGDTTTLSPNVTKDDNITFVDEDENGSGSASGDGISIQKENRNQKIVKKEVESGDFVFVRSTLEPKEKTESSITNTILEIEDVTAVSSYSTKHVSLQDNNYDNEKKKEKKEFYFDDNEDDTYNYSGSGNAQDHYFDNDNFSDSENKQNYGDHNYFGSENAKDHYNHKDHFSDNGGKQTHVDDDSSASGVAHDDQDDNGSGSKDNMVLINEELNENSTIKETDKDFDDYLEVKQTHVDDDSSASGVAHDDQDDNGSGSKDNTVLINEELNENSTIKETDKDFDDYLEVISNDVLGMNLTSISDDYFIIVDGYDYSFGGPKKEVVGNEKMKYMKNEKMKNIA
ncbi:dentin sialophosphoprotein-like isoform X1 [Tribolium madens]|uniref:dentin sialophosphoprotein-like isoform X1 n=1 Tax=Tribolium madens TaxID=41895 RepID=UPI001CF766CD|nr:dentin sialophosphoprotein-like isoform X1 [Tribolium madens]